MWFEVAVADKLKPSLFQCCEGWLMRVAHALSSAYVTISLAIYKRLGSSPPFCDSFYFGKRAARDHYWTE